MLCCTVKMLCCTDANTSFNLRFYRIPFVGNSKTFNEDEVEFICSVLTHEVIQSILRITGSAVQVIKGLLMTNMTSKIVLIQLDPTAMFYNLVSTEPSCFLWCSVLCKLCT